MITSLPDQVIVSDTIRLINNYGVVSSTVLWLADFLATFPIEVATIWLRKPTFHTIVFLLNRYMLLLYLIANGMFCFLRDVEDNACSTLGYLAQVYLMVCTIASRVLLTHRVSALGTRKKAVILLSGTLLSVRLGLLIYTGFILRIPSPTAEYRHPSYLRCRFRAHNPTLLAFCTQILTPAVDSVFDVFTIALTLRRCYYHAVEMRRLRKISVAQTLLRDEIRYFVISFLLEAVSLSIGIISLLSRGDLSPQRSAFFELASPFSVVIPNLLVNRLVLNLRACTSTQIRTNALTPHPTTSCTSREIRSTPTRNGTDAVQHSNSSGAGMNEVIVSEKLAC